MSACSKLPREAHRATGSELLAVGVAVEAWNDRPDLPDCDEDCERGLGQVYVAVLDEDEFRAFCGRCGYLTTQPGQCPYGDRLTLGCRQDVLGVTTYVTHADAVRQHSEDEVLVTVMHETIHTLARDLLGTGDTDHADSRMWLDGVEAAARGRLGVEGYW